MNRRYWNNDALWAVVGQLVFAIIFSSIVWIHWGLRSAVSIFVGGMICVLPNIYLYMRVFSYFGAQQAQKIANAFYWGEMIKLVMTAGLFTGAFFLPYLIPLWLFIGYILAQFGFWLGPILMGFWKNKNKQ
jgi:ATP synthase protein I